MSKMHYVIVQNCVCNTKTFYFWPFWAIFQLLSAENFPNTRDLLQKPWQITKTTPDLLRNRLRALKRNLKSFYQLFS